MATGVLASVRLPLLRASPRTRQEIMALGRPSAGGADAANAGRRGVGNFGIWPP
jgi:hypothetical protein